ncbi:MAG: hypothetical protein HYX63_16495 [Gammaproteobacteria bacterium]|nr:hypothetical protein [Gammaproteobacteria bacterium]
MDRPQTTVRWLRMPLSLQGVTAGALPSVATESPSGRRRLAHVGVGHTLYAGFNWLFDHVIYVYVVYQFGMLRGGLLMTALSFAQCAGTLVLYQRMRIDWVGAGLLAEIRLKPRPNPFERFLLWADARHSLAIFTLLCIVQDPFITTAYFKRGQFDVITRGDWGRFILSVIVANFYWVFIASALGHVAVAVWTAARSILG